MRVVPDRSIWLQIIAVLGGFSIGPFAAVTLADLLVPGSEVVQVVGSVGFAAVFLVGTMVWMGMGMAAVVFRAFASLIRGRLPRAPGARGERTVPPGYRSYIVLGAIAGALVGLVAGLATPLPLIRGGAAWTLLGAGYGTLLWWAAHHGYLPFPEPE